MSDTVIKVENISKFYQLGLINHGTLAKDLQGWWAKIRGKEDPNSRVSLLSSAKNNSDNDFIYALKDVSFDVKQGEVLGIIGANGAGKSTLLKILSRVTSPTSGCIKIKGRIGSLLEVGTGFHPELTGRENIYLNGAILGMRKHEIDKKLDEIIDFSGVEKFIDTPVKRYSSGMYVRLAFAVAAHLDPEILVVDEVLAVGDADFQKKCLGKMDDVSKKEGRTVLFVSHNMAAVRQLCTRGILLRNGELVFNGDVNDCINGYAQTSITNLISHAFITPDMHASGFSNEITIEEATLLNDPAEMSTDEPIEIELVLKNHFSKATQCRYSVNIFDETDMRIIGYVSEEIPIPQNKETFKVRCQLENHSLTKRRYKMSLNVGYKDFGTNVKNFDVVKGGVLTFEIKYLNKKSKSEYVCWNRNWGAVIHQGCNINVEVL
ncbi:ABC transporter ATP-binding protein [bacterium]|nr:ABC transporter ATP-binding protein [bacterium]